MEKGYKRRGPARTLDELIADLPPAERETIERRAAELRQLALTRQVARKRGSVLRKLAE